MGLETSRHIITKRLILVPHGLDDVDDCARMWADPAVVRMIRDTPFSYQETWSRILRYAGHWSLLGYGYWVIRNRENGRFHGELGFARTYRTLPGEAAGLPEVGCTLERTSWGRSIGQEATLAVLRWMDDVACIRDTAAITDERNHAALAVLTTNGYRHCDQMDFEGKPFSVLVRRADALGVDVAPA